MKKSSKHKNHRRNPDRDVATSSTQSTSDKIASDSDSQTEQEHERNDSTTSGRNETAQKQLEQIFWSKSTNEEEKTREEEFDEYLADLLL